MAVRVRNARSEGRRLHDELVGTATRLLASGDPTAGSLRGVARETGVAAPSVYGHFVDLDALLPAVVQHHLADLAAPVAALPGLPTHEVPGRVLTGRTGLLVQAT